jgi:hypothetical protein
VVRQVRGSTGSWFDGFGIRLVRRSLRTAVHSDLRLRTFRNLTEPPNPPSLPPQHLVHIIPPRWQHRRVEPFAGGEEQAGGSGEVTGLAVPAVQRSVDAPAEQRAVELRSAAANCSTGDNTSESILRFIAAQLSKP